MRLLGQLEQVNCQGRSQSTRLNIFEAFKILPELLSELYSDVTKQTFVKVLVDWKNRGGYKLKGGKKTASEVL